MHVGKPFFYISITDPAINQPAMGPANMGKYLESGDPDLLVILPGAKPARFACRRLDTNMMQGYVQKGEDRQECWNRAFRMGCLRIENAYDVNEQRHASPLEPAFEQPSNDGSIVKTWTDKQMNLIPSCAVNDVGRIIYQHSFLALSTGVCYPVPPRFRMDVETLLYRDVGDQGEA